MYQNYIDSYQPKGLQGQWNTPPYITNVPQEIPPNLSDEQFTGWIFSSIMNEPEKICTAEGADICRSLAFGATIGQGVLEPTDRNKIFNKYKDLANHRNNVENVRAGNVPFSPHPFVINARQRQQRTV